jgi:uncharacterized membrane protein YkvI
MGVPRRPPRAAHAVTRWKEVLRLAGAYIAFLIGAGFATGQETRQFFAAFGGHGLLGVGVVFAGSAYLAVTLYLAGRRHRLRNADDVLRHYAGPLLGPAFGWYTVLVSFSLYVVMLSGAGAVLQEAVALPTTLGAAAMAVAVLLTLYFGLHELVNVIGAIGPLLVLLIVVIAGVAVIDAPVPPLTASLDGAGAPAGLRAASSRWVSALLYLALLQPPMAAFLPPASGELIPMLSLAQQVTPRLATIFPWIVIAGVFTTAAPMLWITAVRLADDGSARYRLLLVLLGGIGYVLSVALPFDRLVNLIFPTIGWSGSVLVACVLWKQLRTRALA